MREGYVMALRNAVDEYVQAILQKSNAAVEHAADLARISHRRVDIRPFPFT